MLTTFSFRHLVRHRGMNVAILVGMTLCSALVSALPIYAAVVAGRSLSQSLDDAYAFVRNLEVRGDQLTDAERKRLYNTLGGLVEADYEFREATVDVERAIYDVNDGFRRVQEILFLRLWSVPMAEHVTLLDGRLPVAEPVDTVDGKTVLEAVVGAQAREQIDVDLDDEVALEKAPYRLRIVGVVAPSDAGSDLWWSDAQLLPFDAERVPTEQVDNLYLSLLLAPEAMDTYIPSRERYWRVLLDWRTIGVDNAQTIRDSLVELKAQLSASRAEVQTGLVALLDRYRSQVQVGRASLLLLTVQSLLAGLYVLGMLGADLVDRSGTEFASMVGRGFSNWQIVRYIAVEMALLGAVSLPLGPLLAYGAFGVWSRLAGQPGVHHLPTESWLLSAIAVGGGWISLVVPAYLASRRGLLQQQHERARPTREALWRGMVTDAFVLILGGMAYWQLRQTGTFVRQAEASGMAVDPILLLGPSLLLLSLGLVFRRVFPLVLRLLAWLSQRERSLVVPFGITGLARRAGGPGRVLLLITLSAALVLFATVFRDSIVQRQREIAHYTSGADVRVVLPAEESEAEADAALVEATEGVTAAAKVYRNQVRWSPLRATRFNAQPLAFMAVDPERFGQVARYPPGVGGKPMSELVAVLRGGDRDAIPLLASAGAPPGDLSVGDTVQYYLGTRPYDFEVRAIVDEFPTLSSPFVVADLRALQERVDLDAVPSTTSTRELWLAVNAGQQPAVLATIERQIVDPDDAGHFRSGRVVADAAAELRTLRSDLIARISTAAFGINAIVLVVFGAASFFLVQVFAARRRALEFGVLRAMGVTPGQLLGLLSLEGVLLVVLGVGAGIAVGLGMAQVMRPFLSLTLASSLGESAIDRVVMDWATLGPAYVTLVGLYVLSLILLLGVLQRSDIHRTLRLGGE
jgi:putative ABC transport system permease protein